MQRRCRRAGPECRFTAIENGGLHRITVPSEIRKLGITVYTLASVYGDKRAQGVADETWLRRAGREDWVVLTKDDKIRRRPTEMEAFRRAKVRVFCLTTAELKAQQQARRFVNNMNRICSVPESPVPTSMACTRRDSNASGPSSVSASELSRLDCNAINVVEPLIELGPQTGEQVPVAIHRRGDRRVTEPRLDFLRVGPLRDENRSTCVPKVVDRRPSGRSAPFTAGFQCRRRKLFL